MTTTVDTVYEMMDVSDDEGYRTLGLWRDLAEAIRELDACAEPEDAMCGEYSEDYVRVEIRERKLGWGEQGKVVHTREWRNIYDEAADEYKWVGESKAEVPK